MQLKSHELHHNPPLLRIKNAHHQVVALGQLPLACHELHHTPPLLRIKNVRQQVVALGHDQVLLEELSNGDRLLQHMVRRDACNAVLGRSVAGQEQVVRCASHKLIVHAHIHTRARCGLHKPVWLRISDS